MTARPVPLPCGPTPDPARESLGPTRGECSTCGRFVVLKSNGTLRYHVDSGTKVNGWGLRCRGCDQPPRVPAAAEHATHGGPARTALRPADAEAHSPEESR